MSTPKTSSYGQILKSSSIIGGAQGVNYLIGLVRTKLVAVLLGPSGVGLVGLYVSATTLVGTLAGLGIGSSGVREVAEAHATGDADRVARTVKTLRRACWVTGLLGWLLSIALAYPLSLWTFGTADHSLNIALLGGTLLLTAISSGQTALLQGTRRIGDLARLNVTGVSAGTIVAVGLYAWLGVRGIVPVLITTAAVNLGFSWWFAHRIHIEPVHESWRGTWNKSKRLLGLGLAFMWSSLLAAGVALAISSIIVRSLGLDANGIYQAAWGVSGVFAGFILSAMGTDFYPRLTAVAADHRRINQLVNEQTEIGILLALPGLLGTLVFAPFVIRVFYTEKFIPGAELLQWFSLGIFGQIISWPLGFVILAKGVAAWYALSESCGNLLRLGLSAVLLHWLGLWGAALAFPLTYGVYALGLLWICKRLTGFRWSPNSLRLIGLSAALILAAFVTRRCLPFYPGLAIGVLITVTGCIVCLRGLIKRLGRNHRACQWAHDLPLLRRLLAA